MGGGGGVRLLMTEREEALVLRSLEAMRPQVDREQRAVADGNHQSALVGYFRGNTPRIGARGCPAARVRAGGWRRCGGESHDAERGRAGRLGDERLLLGLHRVGDGRCNSVGVVLPTAE